MVDRTLKRRYDQQSDLQNRFFKETPSPKDVLYNLEIIAEKSRKHTELLYHILVKQGEQKDDIGSLLEQQEETQKDIAEEEETHTFTLECIGTTVAGFKTLMYTYMGIMAAVPILGIIWKHTDPPTTHTPPPTHIPPAKRPKRPSMFKVKSDLFEM